MTSRAARVETPADTLRQAAALVREAAATKSAAPWRQSGLGVSDRDGNYVHDDPELSDGYWIAMLGPQIAEPLAAWLDIEAQRYEVTAERMSEEWAAGEVQEATDFACVLLGVPVPEPDGEGT